MKVFENYITNGKNNFIVKDKNGASQCPQCASEDFSHDEIDMMGDGVEEHLGKTAIVCNGCNVVVSYI